MAHASAKSLQFDVINQKMTKAAQTFINMQIKEAGKKMKGRRFSLREKVLALSLYKPSPKAYRLLSEICILPKQKTLQKLLQNVDVLPGVNEKIFANLKKKVAKMPSHHRFCTLVLDEMAIGLGLTLDRKGGIIIGVEDNGIKRKKNFADHALVLMIRGVVKKFKQPVAYSFCNGTTKTFDLKEQIKTIIHQMQLCGLEVVATVCDQGATNIAAVNSLLNDTRAEYLRRGIDQKGSFFEISGKKIFPIFDPPHLMKGIRNNLLNKNLVYTNNNKKTCVAKWQHIVQLYTRSPGYKGVRLVPKLTAYHVMPRLIPKMKVKHCTQVFSRTVGVTMGFMAGSLGTRFLYD